MMSRNLTSGWCFLPALLLLACLEGAMAATPTPEQLMPANTTEFVAVSDLARMERGWLQTRYGRMVNDPALKPFITHLTPAVKSSNYLVSTIGISWDAVRASCSGELGWGMVPIEDKEVAHILTMDLANRGQQAKVLQDEMIKALQKQGARFETRQIDGVQALVVELPKQKQIVYSIKDGVLIVTDHLPTFQGILARWNGQANNSLANHKPYQVIQERCKPKQGEQPSVARWYFDVMNRFRTQLIFDKNLRKVKGDNFMEVLSQQGFDAVKGAGGAINFAENGLDIIVRGSAYGPPPYRSSMRMAKFENATPLNPEPWVPDDVYSVVTLNIDLANAFDAFDTLFERLAGEPAGVFKETMEFLAKDKHGPQVDLRKEIFQNLENRVTVINDAVQPVSAKSERFLVGTPIKGGPDAEKEVAEALKRCFETDKQFKKIEIAGQTVWQYHERVRKGKNQPRVQVASIVFAVSNHNLYIATHAEILEKVLLHKNQAGMARSQDYQQAMLKLAKDLNFGPAFSRSFVRVGESARNTYEMTRANKLVEAESLYAWVLTKVLRTDENGNKVWFNGGLLPEYGHIERYLGNVAVASVAHEDGWSATAIVMPK